MKKGSEMVKRGEKNPGGWETVGLKTRSTIRKENEKKRKEEEYAKEYEEIKMKEQKKTIMEDNQKR